VPVDGQRLKSALEDILNNVVTGAEFREKIEYAERAAERYKGELQQVEARDGKPFEYADELKQAKEKLAEYEELMKAEMAEKEAKYAEMDASVEAAKGVQLSDEDSEEANDNTSYRIVDDPDLLNELEDGEWEEAYRVMQVIDGQLYPPMAAVREGDLVSPIKLGLIEQAEEHPELIIFDEDGKPQYLLNKGQGKGSLKAAYNPYWHTSRTALNDQFTSAHVRPNLVVVRTLVPKSELTSGYKAQYAKDAVGEISWHSGSVSGQLAELGRPRRVILSRYDKPMEIIPHAEVAKMIAEQLRDTDIAIPYNVVWPQLRDELEKLGVEISDEASGTVGDDASFGKAEYVTDKMIADMNEKAKRGMPQTPEAKRTEAERLAKKFNTPINIIDDTSTIEHVNPTIQARRRKSKGWYDTATGEVNVVLENNRNVEDVAATVFHETVGHKGLRELIGDDNYNDFLREVYEHLKVDVRRRIVKLAEKHNWDFEKATDEYLSGLAEKGFEDFDREERSVWQWLKEKVLKAIDKFLKSLKLPKWVKFGDNELRYILWRSKERLERGKEHPIDLARDIVKREELGLGEDNTLYSETKKDAHPTRLQTSDDAQAVQRDAHLSGTKVEINSENREEIDKNLSSLAEKVAESQLPAEEFLAELRKSMKTESEDHSGYNIQVIDGEQLTMRISDHHANAKHNKQNGEFKVVSVVIKTPYSNNRFRPHKEVEMVEYTFDADKLTHDNEQNIVAGIQQWLETGQCDIEGAVTVRRSPRLISEDSAVYRDPDETEDIWNDQSLGLQERITAAATRLANNHRDNKTLRNDAMRAIGGNLSDLRKAMSLQRTFDMTTVKRVADLARVLMNNGYLNGLTQQEVKRLLAAVKNSVGHNDIEGDVQKVMDIMVDNQLKHAEDTLHELEAIRGSKVDARGVEVQGQLDPAGAHTMKVFKKTRGWEKTDIEEAISEAQQRMGSSDVAVADEAALEYTGLQLALEYAENIKDSKVEERKLREEIKQAHDDASERDRATDSYRQYIASLQEAIRQNKIERAQSYFDLVGRLSDSLRESIANAKDFKEAEKQRIREIQHNANSDMEGRPSDEHYKPTFADKFVNNSFVSFLFAPLATFDQMLRMFGGKSANGEGYLYNRFMRGWIDARQQEINGVRDKYAILDAKAAELFGGKVKTWGDLIRRVGKLPKGTVSFWNGGEMQERELTQGNLMYIYMVNKMLDGRMKLRKMGITEENVADIEEVLDPRLIELADWLQDEFLVQTRNEYNETHKRMFGASMAAIEHYFPLKILANARADKPEDLDNPDKSDGISTATGSIIKRRRNALALDITGADALSVILDHVAQMEHWNAFAEFNRDINTLRTYKRFRNQVQNMTTIYGSGKELWKKFNDVCQMAAGTYRPPRTKLDEAAVNFAKGVTAAKVSFRMFTALKQFLSMPAYIPETRTDYLLRNIANPVGAWKWSMEHLPIFNERWRSRMSGDPRLLKSDMDWKMWRTRLMQLASRAGMSPNAFVDALTVSIGAHSMYQTRLAQYLRDGYSEADAEKKAVQDAEVLYNQTQQSSEGAFTSTMQVDRSWLSVLFTVFRNASMSYQRQLHDALRNFKHNLTPGGRARSIEFMTKQLLRDKGIEPQTDGNWSDADWQREEQVAKRKFRRQLLKDTLRVATFGYIMQFAWNLGAYLPYLLFGDDEDEKQKMWDDVWAHTAFGSVEGLTGGDLMSQAGQMMLTGEGNPAYLSKDMPLTSDIMAAFQKLGNGQHTEALNDMINLIVQAGLGVNPQSITDVALSIMDACGDDPALAHEATICISRILQVPQSQIDKMYFDEVGLSGDEVSKYTPAQLAERYAQFKVKRGRFFSPWSWGDEERIKKFTDKANKTIKERTEQMGDDKVNEAYLQYEEVYKGVDAKVKEAKKTAKTDYVEAAQLMAEAQSDPNAFATYQMFKQMDSNFNKIVKFYLGAKTPDEAALCRQAVLDYKSAMVKVLDAPDAATREEAMGNLGNVMQEFAQKYVPMQQPNR
jgi:transposase